MRNLSSVCLASLMAAACASAALAAGPSGRYLITLHGQPGTFNGAQYCATVVKDGSTNGYRDSGTVVLQDQEGRGFPGTWFALHGVAYFEVPLPETSNSASFIVFSGRFGTQAIAAASLTEVINGAPAFNGSFTAVENSPGC